MSLLPAGGTLSTEPGGTAEFVTPGWLIAAAVVCASYVALVGLLTPFPLNDYPNHLTRGAIIADLLFHHGERFGSLFDFHFRVMPYLLHDLLLAGCVELFGISGGAAVFSTITLLSLPCALLFYMHANRLAPGARLPVFLIGLYLATDWFYLLGFMGFRLAVALIVVTVALTDMLRQRWSVSLFVTYLAVLVLGYLTHLTTLVFAAVAVGTSAAVRWWLGMTTVRRESALLIPIAVLCAVHFGIARDTIAPPAYRFEWARVNEKVARVLSEFHRYGGRPATAMMVVFAACLLWPIRRQLRWSILKDNAVRVVFVVAVVFFIVYLALPRQFGDATYVDVRALPMVTVFLVFTSLYIANRDEGGRAFGTVPVLAMAMLLAVGNLGYLIIHGVPDYAWMNRYRALLASIPRDAYVLPIYTEPQASILPYLHLDSFVVLDRHAVMPYLFSADRGDPVKYFHYIHPPYMPEHWWYKALEQAQLARTTRLDTHGHAWFLDVAPVDWARVACDYDFLLVTVPFDGSLIRLGTTTAVTNSTAAVLSIDKRQCQRSESAKVPP